MSLRWGIVLPSSLFSSKGPIVFPTGVKYIYDSLPVLFSLLPNWLLTGPVSIPKAWAILLKYKSGHPQHPLMDSYSTWNELQSLCRGSQGPGCCGSADLISFPIPAPPALHAPAWLASSAFLHHPKYILASGPLHLLFSLPEIFHPPESCMAHSFILFGSLFHYHLTTISYKTSPHSQ